MHVMNKKWDSITNIAQCTSVYVSPEHEIKAVPTGGGAVYRLGQYETAEIARAVLNDLYMHISTGCVYQMPNDQRALVMAATAHLTFGFGKERLARLKKGAMDDYRQYIGWVKTDGEDCAKEWLKRCVEQALHEELKVNDIQSGSRPPKQYYSSGVDVADMIRVTGAVSAKMAAERGIKRVPLAVLSQSEVTRRMKTI